MLASCEIVRADSQQEVSDALAPADVLRCGRAKCGFRGMVSQFEKVVSQAPSSGELLKPYKQRNSCTAVCCHYDAFQTVNLRDMIVTWSKTEAASRTTKAQPLSVQRLLYGFEIDGRINFGLLACGSLQAGTHQARQNWVIHRALVEISSSSEEWSTGVGIKLTLPMTRFERSLHPLAQQSPYESIQCGELSFFAEQDFADQLVSGAPCNYVVIKKFCYELDDDDDTLAGVIIIKLDESFAVVRKEPSVSNVPISFTSGGGADGEALGNDIDYLEHVIRDERNDAFADEEAFLEDLGAVLSQEGIDLLAEMQEDESLHADDDEEAGPSPPSADPRAPVALQPLTLSDSLQYKRAAALSIADNSVAVYDFLEVIVFPSWHIIDRENQRWGTIRSVQGHLMQMTCLKHPKGALLLTSEKFHEVEAQLVKWLCTGPSHSSQKAHYIASESLRFKYNRRTSPN